MSTVFTIIGAILALAGIVYMTISLIRPEWF